MDNSEQKAYSNAKEVSTPPNADDSNRNVRFSNPRFSETAEELKDGASEGVFSHAKQTSPDDEKPIN